MFRFNKIYKIRFLAALLLSAAVFTLLLPAKVYAASVLIEFSARDFIVEEEEFRLEISMKADEIIGDVNARFYYDTSLLQYVSGPASVTAQDGIITVDDYGPGAANGEKSYLLTFLAIKSGDAEFRALDKPVICSYTDNVRMAVSVVDASIFVRSTASLSGNSSLSDMALYDLSGNLLRISPAFETDTYEYGAKVPFGISKVIIVANPEERHAKVEVAGESGLQVGSNAVKVIVTAENGKRQTYTVLVIREGLDTIDTDENGIPKGLTPTPTPTPEIQNPAITPEAQNQVTGEAHKNGVFAENGKYGLTLEEHHTYTSANAAGLEVPEGFAETKLYIDSIPFVAYEAPTVPAEFLLVPLKNEENELKWYLYDRVEQTFQRVNDAKVSYVTIKADYNEELLLTLEEYEQKQQWLLIITGVAVAGCVVLLALLLKNQFAKRK
ncbi:MAG: cadherin-like beta sandwich domain-containing protein [Lachnospiraceae bacterium]|nr:cadherin-like beta sandwich domain-containing protein [Lachnospiraceae bacterium]